MTDTTLNEFEITFSIGCKPVKKCNFHLVVLKNLLNTSTGFIDGGGGAEIYTHTA